MDMNPIGWIEIPVIDLDRAEKFYKDFLGFDFQRQSEMNGITMSWFPMDQEKYGSAATLIKGDMYKPSYDGSTIYFTAPETVEASLKKAEEMGAKILLSKTSIGEHGVIGWVEDSEGNRIAVHSMKG